MLNNLYQSLDPVAFTIGPFSARWYGLAYVAGFICVIAIMYVVGKRWKMRFDFDSLWATSFSTTGICTPRIRWPFSSFRAGG